MTKILAGFLRSGGKLIVSDFRTNESEIRKDYVGIIAHHGMAEDVMRGAFAGAGLTDVIIEDGFDYILHERVLHIFFTVGSKA